MHYTLKHLATQLSKITGNWRYDFSDELSSDYKQKDGLNYGWEIEQFFQDAFKFSRMTDYDGYYDDRDFMFSFENEEDANTAKELLENMGEEILEVDEILDPKLNYSILVSDTIHDFVFGEDMRSLSPLRKIARRMTAPIRFTYYHTNDVESPLLNEGVIYPDMSIEFNFGIKIVNVLSLEDIHNFALTLFHFSDVFPTMKAYQKNSVNIE